MTFNVIAVFVIQVCLPAGNALGFIHRLTSYLAPSRAAEHGIIIVWVCDLPT